MSKPKESEGPWKGMTIILLVLLIAMAGIGGYILYMNAQKINNLENILYSTQNELSQTKETLDFSERMLELSSENSSSLEALIEEYRQIELRYPSIEELDYFLSEDYSDEGNYSTFAEWIELNLKLKDNAKEWNIRAGLVTVKYNCEFAGELREGGWTLFLVTELDDGKTVYFSPENDEIYDSVEQLLNDWPDVSDAEFVDGTIYW
jgi:hypothetical protein